MSNELLGELTKRVAIHFPFFIFTLCKSCM